MKTTIKTYWGPSPFSRRPCVTFRFDGATEVERSRMRRSCMEVGRYLEREFAYPFSIDRNGTAGDDDAFAFLADAALFLLNYVRGDLDESGFVADGREVTLFVEFHRPKLVEKAVRLLLDMLFRFPDAAEREFTAVLHAFWDECLRAHPDFQAHALITAAKSRNIHYASLGKNIWLYGMGAKGRVFVETSTIEDLKHGPSTDKLAGKEMFRAVGAPTAPYRIVKGREDLSDAIRDIGFPCVFKPVDADSGKGVTANVGTPGEVEFAFAEAGRHCRESREVMVEEFVPGRDYRLLFVRGAFVGCASSLAPCVVGDGVGSVRELIGELNSTRTRNLYGSNYLRPITIDEQVIETLSLQGLGLDAVPEPGENVTLRRNTNLGGGGFTELFENVHPDVLAVAGSIARHTGLHSVGVDYITEDITASPAESGGKFTEVNKVPGVPLFLAAGYDITELGSRLLGEEIGNVEVHFHILQTDDYRHFLTSCSGGYAIFLPDIVVRQGRASKVRGFHFRRLIDKVLADRSLESLDVVALPAFVEASGFPTEYLSMVTVGKSCGTQTVNDTIEKLGCPVRYL